MKTLQKNFYQWQYKVYGKGKKIVVIFPNILLFPEEWLWYAQKLGSQYKVIIPIYPQIVDYHKMLSGINALFKKLHVKQCILVGNSVGGMVAQGYAKKYPEGIKKIILLTTIGPNQFYGFLTGILCCIGFLMPQRLIQEFAYWATEKSLIATKENQTYWIPQFRQHIFTHLSKEYFLSLGQCIAKFCLFNRYVVPSEIPLITIDSEGDIVFPSLFANLATTYPKATHYGVRGGLHLVELNKKKDLLAILQKNL